MSNPFDIAEQNSGTGIDAVPKNPFDVAEEEIIPSQLKAEVPIKIDPLQNFGVFRPSEHSSGQGLLVGRDNDPDYDFTRATGGGIGLIPRAIAPVVNKAMELAGKGVVAIANIPTTISNKVRGQQEFDDGSATPGYAEPLRYGEPKFILPELDGDYSPTVRGAYSALKEALEGFTTPEMALTLPFLGLKTLSKPAAAAFSAQIAANMPESIRHIADSKDAEEASKAVAKTLIEGMMLKATANHATKPASIPKGEVIPPVESSAVPKAEAVSSPAVNAFEQNISSPEFKGGNKLSTETGLGVKNIFDLQKLAELRKKYDAETRDLNAKAASSPREQQMDLIVAAQRSGQKSQLAREAIEVATDTGSWIESEAPPEFGKLGERPLDWRKNSEAAAWLKENAKDLGIKLPDDFGTAKPNVNPVENLPPVNTGFKRLYRGQEGEGAGGIHWTDSTEYASRHGKNLQYVDVPEGLVESYKTGTVKGGSKYEISDSEITKYVRRVEDPVNQKVQDLMPEEEIAASKIESAIPKRDIFEMDDVELGKVFDEQFGSETAAPKPGEFGRSRGQYTFSDYDAFKKWMDERHSEKDLDGMKLAFAEADRAFKVKYIKDNMASDPLKKAWISHLATGSELPKELPPVARTTPRPLPGGGFAPPPNQATPPPASGGGNARQQPPPPPPRNPTNFRKFDITALVQLFRQFRNAPTMNSKLKSAYGRFVGNTKSGVVELKGRLLWDEKLAERVLAHEIGHFVDYVVAASGKGKGVAGKMFSEIKGNIAHNEQLKKDAVNLSSDWRGSFAAGDKYRNSPSELFADFMSAMFNEPEWVNQKYPRLYDAFQNIRDSKPSFKSAYREIETWLQGGTMSHEIRAQDRKAVERTMDILSEKNERRRASFVDRLFFDIGTIWNRAFQMEGKPREIGNRVIDKLETSYMWAAKRMALWHDDFLKRVQPFLDKVSDDPAQARADLLSYSKAVRTIGERRAAGVWIEKNPDLAREMLEKITDADMFLRHKFSSEIKSTPNDGIYDLSAKVFREIHDRGKEYAARISKIIDQMDLGVDGDAAMMAFNVRGKLLNPSGLTEATSAKMIADIKDSMSPEQFSALEEAAKNLRDLLYDTQKEMYNNGLISKKVWDELIAPNKDSYVPYAVLDYFDGKVKAGVMPQSGTAKDVADVAISTELKVASAFAWLQKQRQVQLLRDAWEKGGSPIPLGRKLKRASEIDRLRNENPNDPISRAVIWKDGNPHLVEFLGDNGKLIQDALTLPEFYGHIDWMHDASNLVHKGMQLFTQLSPRFLLWRNIIRGFRTAGLKVGFAEAAKQMGKENFSHNMRLARNYADAAFGAEMLPEVRRLVEIEALPPPRIAAGAVRDLPNMRELIARGALPIPSLRNLKVNEKTSTIRETLRKSKNFTDKVFTAYEAFEKIYNFRAATSKGLPENVSAQVARRGGIPNPGSVGKWSSAIEILFPWTRVRMQGMRSTLDMMRDPRFSKGFATRFAVTEALPRIAKVALALGIIKKGISLFRGEQDDSGDDVMAEVMKRISPYKMALDDVVPTMLFDPRTGKYHYFWEYSKGSEIPKHFEVVSVRIPSSEEGNVWGTMLYNAMVSIPGVGEKLGAPGSGVVGNMGEWAIQNLVPSSNPLISTGQKLVDMTIRGRNPEDEYRGQPSANEQLFNAGGKERAQAITGYALGQLGGPGELGGVIAANFGLLDPRSMASLNRRLASDSRPWSEKIPFIGTVLSYDNYGTYRDEKNAEKEDTQIRSKARLLMPQQTRQLYDFYYRNIDRRDKLTDSEQAQFEIASEFVNQIWGKMTIDGQPNPDSFYSKAAHAVGDDGSKHAKETFKRDIENASQMLVIEFEEIRKKP